MKGRHPTQVMEFRMAQAWLTLRTGIQNPIPLVLRLTQATEYPMGPDFKLFYYFKTGLIKKQQKLTPRECNRLTDSERYLYRSA